ncbi:hypothetical protein DPMN_150507 [Dreissena polymorpha]|uniref:Sulfotransferase domain-containing protein n=1 Tax=Dreissena polymorpha TaxID=45954 RepID=A0A9D4FHU6_DREPO|nr:hypothetical protein DPMN_150507 [Dreissena polymorpha]
MSFTRSEFYPKSLYNPTTADISIPEPCGAVSWTNAMESIITPDFFLRQTNRHTPKEQFFFFRNFTIENHTSEISIPRYFRKCVNITAGHLEITTLMTMNHSVFNDLQCPIPEPHFWDRNKWHTALASYMGSGNTWVRHLIETMSGVLTGSLYNDRQLLTAFEGEGQTERVIVIKTHELAMRHNHMFNRAVLLVRNPYDTILAWYNFERSKSHKGYMDRVDFVKRDWIQFIPSAVLGWRRFIESWVLDFHGPVFLLSYKRLQTDFFNEIIRVALFLDIPLTFGRLRCLHRESEGGYHRDKPSWMTRENVFTIPSEEVIEKELQLVRKVIWTAFNTTLDDLE